MSKVIRLAKTLRNHWKKSLFAFSVAAYGISYGYDKYRTFEILRAYCERAKCYGEVLQPSLAKPRHVTVILNPEANDKKARIRYEKFAAPLLHLAGLKVSVVETENEGQASDLMEIMSNTDAVVIAGGDGTIQEAVTGLLRRPEYQNDEPCNFPVGILPLGKTNSIAKVLFHSKASNYAEFLAEAALSVVQETTSYVDVLKIQTESEKPDFSLASIASGTFPNMETNLTKYWYFGPLKDKVAYFIGSLKRKSLTNEVFLDYVLPCEGCSKCFKLKKERNDKNKRWWTGFLPKVNSKKSPAQKDYSKVVNDQCGMWHNDLVDISNLIISSELIYSGSKMQGPEKGFWVMFLRQGLSMTDYLQTGLDYHKGKAISDYKVKSRVFAAREAKFHLNKDTETDCYIDGQKQAMRECHVTLLPKRLLLYN